MVTEKDVRAFYEEKIGIVQSLEKKWRHLAAAVPNHAPDESTDLLRKLDEIDQRYAEKFGGERFADAARNFAADPRTGAGADRERLRQTLHRAAGVLLDAKSIVREMKDDLGRRISALKSRPRRSRHGQFDKKV